MTELFAEALSAKEFYRCKAQGDGPRARYKEGDICIIERIGDDGDLSLKVVINDSEFQRMGASFLVSAEDFSNIFEEINRRENRVKYCQVLMSIAESCSAKKWELERFLVRLNLEIAVTNTFNNPEDEVLGLAKMLVDCDGDYTQLYQVLGVDVSSFLQGKWQ